MQKNGIPTILVAMEYDNWKYGKYVNDFFPKNAYYAISTKGSKREEDVMESIKITLDSIYEKLDPKGILIFGQAVEKDKTSRIRDQSATGLVEESNSKRHS